MNGRIYDPLLGRFLSADPIIQFPNDLQSYNRYSYVRNNPLSRIDPSGYTESRIISGGIVFTYQDGKLVSKEPVTDSTPPVSGISVVPNGESPGEGVSGVSGDLMDTLKENAVRNVHIALGTDEMYDAAKSVNDNIAEQQQATAAANTTEEITEAVTEQRGQVVENLTRIAQAGTTVPLNSSDPPVGDAVESGARNNVRRNADSGSGNNNTHQGDDSGNNEEKQTNWGRVLDFLSNLNPFGG
jgi:uncharacterized protein RhaS with RHS repeats